MSESVFESKPNRGRTRSGVVAQGRSVSDIVMLNAMELADAIHSKCLSCVEVMSAYLDHIARINPHVNAIISLQDSEDLIRQANERDRELAAGRYRGWMHGFPQA